MGNLTSETEGKVGDFRKFRALGDKDYLIDEIITGAKIKLDWDWDTGICPHCKERISRNIVHDIYRIEILVDNTKEKDKIEVKDLVVLADTLDKRKMILPLYKYNEISLLSKKYKKLLEGGK